MVDIVSEGLAVSFEKQVRDETGIFWGDKPFYYFDKYMNGENEIEQDLLGFFAAGIISKIVKNQKLNEISEQEIFDEIQKI